MKFFIDTADLDEIKEAASMGLLDGVTTNPSLMAKVGADRDKRIKEICEIVDGPVSAEVLSLTAAEMIDEAKKVASLAPNVVVKLPLTPDGIKAAKGLVQPKYKNQPDPGLFTSPGSVGCQGRGGVRQSLCRPTGRSGRLGHGTGRTDRHYL